MEPCKRFEDVMSLLKLESYFPCKITLQHVFEAKLNDKVELKDIKWKILNKIINVDLRARDGELSDILDIIKKQDNIERKKSEVEQNDPTQKEGTKNKTRKKKPPPLFHPQDVLNAVYLCCSPFLKQLMVSKLFMCRIAVPFIISCTQLTGGFLWPFNFVTIDGINSKGKVFEGFLSDQDIKIVSFIRLGEITFSKSDFLNNVLSQDPLFQTFYSRNCPLGSNSKRTLDGTVEASYFIPNGQTRTGSFDDVILFLNHRGDATQYQLHVDVIKSVSNVVVVQLQTKNLRNNDNIGKTLHSIFQSFSSVIIAVESNDDDEDAWLDIKLQEMDVGTKNKLFCIDLKEDFQLRGMNEIVEDTKSEILDCLSCVDCIQFSQVRQVLNEKGIPCDYAVKECVDGCQLADKMFEIIDAKSASTQHFWIELSKLKKNKYREKSLSQKRDIENQIHHIRKQQVNHISHLPEMSTAMIQILYDLKDFPNKLMFFLKSLKLLLDKRSKKILPGLQSSYNDLINDSKKAGSDKYQLEHQTKKLKIEIEDASFGVEHLMREVAQIFDALDYASGKSSWCNVKILEYVENCPSIAANLLIEGYPLEVMDGAAADVPLVWIKKVFRCLESKIGSTAKLLTLSIMGIQSSGKSTLLNAMFGLQLAVSTGRCTKGVFLQLIPMPKDQFPFQYVLVFDTEGLRSNEYRESSVTHVHDNQLATFVVGVADITLINIRGENLSEVSDILEIVVHAFIRMKKVNENFELKQSCIFVHQDVSDTNAERNLLPGTLKLVKCLDEITNEAAEQEHLPNCHSFDRIIHFNHNKHVFYFPNLWLGSPPLCAINTKYSAKVDRLRQFIMSDISERRKTFFSVDEIWTKINDLWEAILSEDFVFSFRNGIELKAIRTAESKFFELHRKLEITLSQFLSIDAESAFRNCENEDNLLKVTSKAKEKLNEKLSTSYENLKKEWTDFIENAPLRDIMIQWKQNRLNQLETYKEEQELSALKEINMMERRTRLEIRQRIILPPKEKEEWEYHANNMVEKCDEHPLDNDIIAAFEKLWSANLKRFNADSTGEFSIDDEIWKIVLHYFQNDTLYLRNEQGTFERQWRVQMFKQLTKMEGCIKEMDITEIHLSGKDDRFANNKKHALTMANKIFSEVDIFVGVRDNTRFNIDEIREIFDHFFQTYQKCAIEARTLDFSLTKNFKAMIAVYIAKYLFAFYQRLHDEFEKNSGLETKRKEYEAMLLNYFRKIISEAMKLKQEKIRKRKEEEEKRKMADEEERVRHQEEIKRQRVQAEAKIKAEKEQNELEIEAIKRQIHIEMNKKREHIEQLLKEEERKRIQQENQFYEEQENIKKLDVQIKVEKQKREEKERILKEEREEIKRHKVQAEAKIKAEKEQHELQIEEKKKQFDKEMNSKREHIDKLMKEEERKRIQQQKQFSEEQENTEKLEVQIKAEKQKREEKERILREEQEEIKRQKVEAEAKMKAQKEQHELEIEEKKRQFDEEMYIKKEQIDQLMEEEERKRIQHEKQFNEEQENTKKLDEKIKAEKQRREEKERILREEGEEIKRQKVEAEAKMNAEKEQNEIEIKDKKRQFNEEMNIKRQQIDQLMEEEERKRIQQEKKINEEQENTKKLDVKIKAGKQRREEKERILREVEDKELQVKLKEERQRQEREQDRITALSITNIIKETLSSHVSSISQSEIVTKILKQFKNSKHKLIKFMLQDLAENEVFDDFYSYIHTTTSYAKKYIEKYTDNKLFTDEKLYFEIAEGHVDDLIDLTKLVVKDVINVSNMDEWSTQITQKLQYINLGCLSSVRYIHVSNFENLMNFIIDDLKSQKDSLICHFKKCSKKSVNWDTPYPYANIFDRLWGCEECCPLCSEPCENTTKNHVGLHECLQHKLNGVSGWHIEATNILCINTCDENVASDNTFYCNRSTLKCQEDPNHITHEYRRYKTYDPTWNIDPDNNLSSKYWPWYICRFEEEIKSKYDVKYPSLQDDWKRIRKDEAIQSLG